MGEDNLIGSLRHLVTTVLAAGDLCLGTTRAGGERPGTGRMTAPVILTEARPGYGKAVLVLGQCLSRSAWGSQVSSLRACQARAWLIRDSLCPLRDGGEIAGLDQFMRLERA
jgi:hypothetical protein